MSANYREPRAAVAKLRGDLLLIRADASVSIGTGHVMRCLALAQAWQDAGGSVTFVMAESTLAIEERLRREDVGLIGLRAHPEAISISSSSGHRSRPVVHRGAHWTATNLYNYERALKKNRSKSP